MATEIVPQGGPTPPEIDNQPALGQKMSRRQLLKVALHVGLLGSTALGAKPVLEALTSHEMPETSQFRVETFPLPEAYKGDFILPPHPRIAAADGGTSVKLSPGRYFVTLGDTLQEEITDTKVTSALKSYRMINNAAVIIDENERAYTIITGSNPDGTDASLIQPKDGTYYWPQNPIIENGTLLIPLIHNRYQQDGWENLGNAIAKFANGQVDTQPEMISLPPTSDYTRSTNWGAAILQDGKQEWTYVAGTIVQKQGNPDTSKELRMARVPYGKMDQLNTWEFYDGNNWISIPKELPINDPLAFENAWKQAEQQATPVMKSTKEHALSQNYTMNLIDGRVVITTKNQDFMGSTIDVYVGETPTGPFTRHTVLDKEELEQAIPNSHRHILRPKSTKKFTDPPDTLTYAAYLHPEVPDPYKKDRVLLTFSISPNVDSEHVKQEIIKNPHTYSRVAVWIEKQKLFQD